jgi:hypothetical protein
MAYGGPVKPFGSRGDRKWSWVVCGAEVSRSDLERDRQGVQRIMRLGREVAGAEDG